MTYDFDQPNRYILSFNTHATTGIPTQKGYKIEFKDKLDQGLLSVKS